MRDLYAHGVDDFGYPLTALEQLRLMQGGQLSEREDALPTDLPAQSRGIDIYVPGDLGFTVREWLDAQFDNYCFNLRAGMTSEEARRGAA